VLQVYIDSKLLATLSFSVAQAGAGGTAPLEPLRPTHGYVGLKNGGATCYMNSVLQQLFMQPRIRALVLACAPTPPDEETDSVFAQLQVGQTEG